MAKKGANGSDEEAAPGRTPTCGIVMPISECDGCPETHWVEVRQIIEAAAELADFSAVLVSTADEVGIIQKRIIQNLYENPIVVCDVSGKNPNVMFELGMRLAFDKPTIIIKDDETPYIFDTSPIEHLGYRRDLRFATIVDFKKELAEKISATHEKATSDRNFTTFLKHFGTFKVASVETEEVSGEEFILEELKELKQMMRAIGLRSRSALVERAHRRGESYSPAAGHSRQIRFSVDGLGSRQARVKLAGVLHKSKDVTRIEPVADGLLVDVVTPESVSEWGERIAEMAGQVAEGDKVTVAVANLDDL